MAELRKSKRQPRCFWESAIQKTLPQMIAKELGISIGNLTYHYPTKEHLLATLAEMLCEFQ